MTPTPSNTGDLIKKLEAARDYIDKNTISAVSVGMRAGFDEAISVVRKHQAAQPQEAVERVARAVHEVMRRPYLSSENDSRDWPISLHEEEIARAAIAAMGGTEVVS